MTTYLMLTSSMIQTKMKTAEEWKRNLPTVYVDGHDCGSFYSPSKSYRRITVEEIKQIQLDAWKQGMIDASIICEDCSRESLAIVDAANDRKEI